MLFVTTFDPGKFNNFGVTGTYRECLIKIRIMNARHIYQKFQCKCLQLYSYNLHFGLAFSDTGTSHLKKKKKQLQQKILFWGGWGMLLFPFILFIINHGLKSFRNGIHEDVASYKIKII